MQFNRHKYLNKRYVKQYQFMRKCGVQPVEGTVVSVDNILALHRQNSFYIHIKRCSLSFLQRKNSEQQNDQYGKNCHRLFHNF